MDTQKIREQGLKEGWEEIEEMVHREDLLYISEIIYTKLISRHYDNSLIDHLSINKIRKLIVQKSYEPTLRANVEFYLKRCNGYLRSKLIKHNPYDNLQFLSITTHW